MLSFDNIATQSAEERFEALACRIADDIEDQIDEILYDELAGLGPRMEARIRTLLRRTLKQV